MIVNMAVSAQEQKVAEIIQSASRRFLNVNIRFAGLIVSDPAVRRASQRMEILELRDDGCQAAGQILQVVSCLLNCSGADEPLTHAENARQAPITPVMGLNDNLDFMGKQFHIQTEDLGYTGRSITTQVFCNGRVFLSTKSEYPESLHNPGSRNQISELMRRQHFNVIRELEKKKNEILSST
jgi:hypothetical protein